MRIAVCEGLREQRQACLTGDPCFGTIKQHLNTNGMFGGLHGEGPWVRHVPRARELRLFEVLCCGDSVQYLST
jgi:hypothetical protein